MGTYRIFARATGRDLGTFEGARTTDALDAYARDAGYRSFAALADALDLTVEAARAELFVEYEPDDADLEALEGFETRAHRAQCRAWGA